LASKTQNPHRSGGAKDGAPTEIIASHEAGSGSRQYYGFFSVVSLMMRGAAWLTTMRSGLFFFGFFFSRLGASLFPMGAACHESPHLARANELPAALSQGSRSLGSVLSGKITYPVPSQGIP
jgi:hypothetical protein